jgi:2-desacetyl-2-hydroxyethyl bacteriochlorophyllide A dehydrogenase
MPQSPAIAFVGVSQAKVVDVRIPAPGPGQVLIRHRYTGVSPGTELRVFAGIQPQMPAHPVVPGYSSIGHVVETGPGCTLKVGQAVWSRGTKSLEGANKLWAGHTKFATVDEADVYAIPDAADVSTVLTSMLAIVTRGFMQARPRTSDRVVVVGLGAIGQLSARRFASHGCQVVAVDLDPKRVQQCATANLSARVASNPLEESLKDVWPDGADMVVDCTGSAKVLASSIRLTRTPPWGPVDSRGHPKLVIQGSYSGAISIDYMEAFMKQIEVHFPRDMHLEDKQDALNQLTSGRLNVSSLVTIADPDHAQQVYEQLRDGSFASPTAAFEWK